MKKLHLCQYVFAILLVGCLSDKKNIEIENDLIIGFPDPITLNGDRILEHETNLLYIKSMDSLLVVSTSIDTLIKIYDKNKNFISGFGRIGRGPNEFNSPPFISEGVIKEDTKTIFAYNSQLLKLYAINLDKSIELNKIVTSNEYEFPSDLRGISNIFYINEDTLMGMYSDHFYRKLDGKKGGFYYFPKTNKFEIFELKNLAIEPYNVMDESNLNARFPILSSDRKKFALVTRYAPIFETLEVGSSSVNTFFIEKYPKTYIYSLEEYKDFELINYYDFAHSSSKYIYLLYRGEPFSLEPRESIIQVLDWGRNPIAQYRISQEYGLSMFVVDEKNSMIYGLSYPNDAIYEFKYGESNER